MGFNHLVTVIVYQLVTGALLCHFLQPLAATGLSKRREKSRPF